MATHTAMAQGNDAALRSSLEQRLGILHFVSPKERAWHGHLRTRFSDFLVYEISKDGEVVHLHDFYTHPRDYARTEESRQASQKPAVVQEPKPLNEITKPASAEAGIRPQGRTASETQNSGKSESLKSENTPETAVGSDKSVLVELLGQDTTDELVTFHTKINQNPGAKPKTLGDVSIPAVSDRAKRSKIHTEVRRVFGGKIDTTTESDGTIKASATNLSNQRSGNRNPNNRSQSNRQNLPGGGAKFLHFTLYKENRDTIDAVNQIARQLNLRPNLFNTAGTKDRRAVTVQRVSMRSRNPQSMLFINNDRIPGVKIGDFKFEDKALYLGCHQGNEFVIVLKNCWFSGTEDLPFDQKLESAKSTVEPALTQLTQQGFINYFGTQRFGTFEIGTQEIGMKILKGNFEGAVNDLLSFDPALLQESGSDQNLSFRRDDINRAKACSTFQETGDFQAALKTLPKRCNVEYTVMRHLERSPKDFLGALQSISRGMRTMYVHAYQSLVWNFVASTRWERHGDRVIKGDLILAKSDRGDEGAAIADEETIHLAEGDATDTDTARLQAHVLTEEEANSGDYTIFDIVLPTPGWDMIYPDNEIGEFYTAFMGKEENGGLNPNDMRRPQKDFSLPGSYRKLMGKLTRTPSVSVRGYSDDIEQLVPTDLDDINSRKAKETSVVKAKSSGWNTFANDVKETERKEAKAETERRKAEDPLDIPEVRLNDTWVQTSLDGSHKRFKVARHVAESGTANSNNTEAMQVDSKSLADQGATTTNPTGGTTIGASTTDLDDANAPAVEFSGNPIDTNAEQDGAKPADSTAITGDELANNESKRVSSISRFTTQVRKIATTFIYLTLGLWAILGINTNANTTKTTPTLPPSESPSTTDPAPGPLETTESKSPSRTNPSDKLTQRDDSLPDPGEARENLSELVASTSADTGEASSKQTPLPPTSDATDKKIAVILRFALDTSQYATIVLRELQGVPSDTDSTDTA